MHHNVAPEIVLLVDDEEPIRRVVRQFLTYSGYTVLEAKQPDEALQLAKCYLGPIHLLITDVMMPGLTGFELAKRLELMRPRMKVLYMSAYQNVKSRSDLDRDGLVLLEKPFARTSLLGKVREVLGSAHAERAQRAEA